jgi:N,N'-diacetylchitobiose transport system permease protein
LRALLTVTLPLIAPGLVATAIFGFIQAWNEYTLALVVMDRPEKETLPLWLQGFNKGARGTDWGGVMAGSTLITAPVIVFFMFVQGRVVSGLTAGAVNGGDRPAPSATRGRWRRGFFTASTARATAVRVVVSDNWCAPL